MNNIENKIYLSEIKFTLELLRNMDLIWNVFIEKKQICWNIDKYFWKNIFYFTIPFNHFDGQWACLHMALLSGLA